MKRNNHMKTEYHTHPVPPVFNENSKVLILGSFPSPKSRETKFFYGHPQNRFWKVIAGVTESSLPEDIQQKKDLILRNNLALWDVIESCAIIGASDSSISDVTPADLRIILDKAPIERVFANGEKAYRLYMKHTFTIIGKPIVKLPSTSPANATWNLNRLIEAWRVILDC